MRRPAWMDDVEIGRECEAEDWDRIAAEWEFDDLRRKGARDYLEKEEE